MKKTLCLFLAVVLSVISLSGCFKNTYYDEDNVKFSNIDEMYDFLNGTWLLIEDEGSATRMLSMLVFENGKAKIDISDIYEYKTLLKKIKISDSERGFIKLEEYSPNFKKMEYDYKNGAIIGIDGYVLNLKQFTIDQKEIVYRRMDDSGREQREIYFKVSDSISLNDDDAYDLFMNKALEYGEYSKATVGEAGKTGLIVQDTAFSFEGASADEENISFEILNKNIHCFGTMNEFKEVYDISRVNCYNVIALICKPFTYEDASYFGIDACEIVYYLYVDENGVLKTNVKQ